ncbi:MAG: hypothetical protein Fur0010_04050 [Bdellovibrio sp.]
MTRRSLAILFTMLFVFSCKTREQIQREQMVDNLAIQVVDSQKLSAEVTVRLQTLEERLAAINGQVEEVGHKNKMTFEERFKKIEERMSVIETQNTTMNQTMSKLEAESVAQKKYLEEVLATLSKLSGTPTKKNSSNSAKTSEYDEAMNLYKKGKYKESKAIMVDLYAGKKVKGNQMARVIHNLGMIEYIDKKNEEAISFFVQLLNEYPKSSYNRNGMLVLVKTFLRLKKNDEAKATAEELAKRYPGSKEANEALKLVK